MKRNGGDKRGSSEDRRKRKVWLLHFFGNGTTCQCVHCGVELDSNSIEQDRIIPGGGYSRKNIQPSCRPCNILRGDSPITPYRPAPTAGRKTDS